MFKILVVEDDKDLNRTVCSFLNHSGYEAIGCLNANEAYDALTDNIIDLIISDIMMPHIDGYALVKQMRTAGNNTPVLMITAKDAFDDMRTGFLAGVDDYMIKPINVNEMVLRIQALLRRVQIMNERKLVIGSTTLECDLLTVIVGDEATILPQKEFMLLYKMASYPGKIFTRQQLIDEVWGYDSSGDTHTVDVHIGRLRDRFRDNCDFKIITIRGIGYKVEKQ